MSWSWAESSVIELDTFVGGAILLSNPMLILPPAPEEDDEIVTVAIYVLSPLPVILNVNPWEVLLVSPHVTPETLTAPTVRPARWV